MLPSLVLLMLFLFVCGATLYSIGAQGDASASWRDAEDTIRAQLYGAGVVL